MLTHFMPLSEEAFQAEIRRLKVAVDCQLHRKLKAAEPHLDRLTLEMCEAMRADRERLPDWLMRAEAEAFMRSRRGK